MTHNADGDSGLLKLAVGSIEQRLLRQHEGRVHLAHEERQRAAGLGGLQEYLLALGRDQMQHYITPVHSW